MIPRIIHQTWKTSENLPWFFKKGQDSVAEHMPDWEYRFWTDCDLESFVQRDYPKFFNRWISLDQPIKRVDTARYMILHRYGGMYADLDFTFKKGVEPLLGGSPLFFYRTTQAMKKKWDFLGNALMLSEPNLPFWIGLLEFMFSLPDSTPVLSHTGPMALGKYYSMLPEKPECTILGPNIFDNEKCADGVGKAEYGHHCRTGTWQR